MSKDRLLASRRLDVALALVEQGDAEAAIDVARAAIEADSDWDEAWFVLGDICERAGQKDAGIDAFRHYMTLDPQDRMGAEVRLTLLGAMAMRDRLPRDYVRALFDDYAPRFEASLRDRLAYRGPELLFEAIRPYLPEMLRPVRVLDLGCGTGLVGDVFAPHVDVIDGIDLSPRMINRAKAKGLYRHLVAGDITELSLLAETPENLAPFDRDYGMAVAADVLNYLGDLAPALRAVHARLKAGGLLVFSIEDGETFPFDLGPGQRFRHHENAVRDWLRETGFDVIADATGILRQEKGAPVTGRIVVARARDLTTEMFDDALPFGEGDPLGNQTLH